MMSFRRLEKSDLPNVRKLIAEAWYGNAFSAMSPERAEKTFKFYIGRHLSRCTYTDICEIDGEFAGFLIGCADGEEPLFADVKFPGIKSAPWWLRLSIRKIIATNNKMKKDCENRGFDSELQMYVTSKKFRGQGVGSALMERFQEYLRSKGKKKMYLYTDDYCNLEYYQKRGFKEEERVKVRLVLKSHEFLLMSLKL